MRQVETMFALAREFALAKREKELALQSAQDMYCKGHPELLSARADLARARVRAARLAMSREMQDTSAQEEAFEKLLREKLREDGLPENHFAYVPRCPICLDLGVVGEDEEVFCECLRQEYARRLKEAGGVDPRQNFAAWDPERFYAQAGDRGYSERQYMDRLKERLEKWCEDFAPESALGLRLVGSTGCGKTFALHAIANALCERGYSAAVTRAYELNRMAAATFSSDWQQPYLNCDFLAIDDLGAEPMYRKITAELFFSIVESRRCAGRPTAIATNLTDEELELRYGSRLYSRLIDRNTTLSFILPVHDLRTDKR